MLSWESTRGLESEKIEMLEQAAAAIAADAAGYVASTMKAIHDNARGVVLLLDVLSLDKYRSKCMLRGYDVTVKREDLTRIRAAVGRLKVANKYAVDADHIDVTVTPEKFPGIRLTYRKGYRGESKCKIVRKEVRSETFALVCEKD